MPGEAAAVALGQLHHEVGGVAIETEHIPRKVEFLLGRPDLIVALGGQDLRGIADRDPADRHDGLGAGAPSADARPR